MNDCLEFKFGRFNNQAWCTNAKHVINVVSIVASVAMYLNM